MNNKTRYLIFIFIIVTLTNCSFDKKTGIWPGDKNERERISELEKKQKDFIEVISFYTSDTAFDKEVNSVKNITLTKPKANTSWTMSGLNLQNFLGHIYRQYQLFVLYIYCLLLFFLLLLDSEYQAYFFILIFYISNSSLL